MSAGAHARGDWARRIEAGWKLAALLIVGTGALLIDSWPWLLALLAGVAALGATAGVSVRAAAAQMRPVVLLVVLVFAAQALFEGVAAGFVAALRLALLALLAGLVSLTTPVSAMTATIERLLRPASIVGLNPARLALAVSLAIRFLPLLAERFGAVREAQRARGVDRSLVALAVPMIVQSLRMADDLAEAIEARGFDPDD